MFIASAFSVIMVIGCLAVVFLVVYKLVEIAKSSSSMQKFFFLFGICILITSSIFAQDARLLFGPWRVTHSNDCRTCPFVLYHIIVNPVPQVNGFRLDSAERYYGGSQYDTWWREYHDSCAWVSSNTLNVWRRKIEYGRANDPYRVGQYKFDSEFRFLSFLLIEPSNYLPGGIDSVMFEQFTYNTSGQLINKINQDKTEIGFHHPNEWEYSYNENGKLSSEARYHYPEYGDPYIWSYTEQYYSHDGFLIKRKGFSNPTHDSLVFDFQYNYEYDSLQRLIHTWTEHLSGEDNSLVMISEWFAYYSNEGLKDSTLTMQHPNGRVSKKEIFTYNEDGEVMSTTSVNSRSYGDSISYSYTMDTWTRSDLEWIRISHYYKDSVWVPSWYSREEYNESGQLIEEESWIYENGVLSYDPYSDGKHIYEWDENGLLLSFQRYTDPLEPGDFPTKKMIFHWSKVNSTDNIDKPKDHIVLYPNPTQDKIWIKGLKADDHSLNIQLFTSNGQLVLNREVEVYEAEIYISHLPDGFYFVRISDGKTLSWQKLMKQGIR